MILPYSPCLYCPKKKSLNKIHSRLKDLTKFTVNIVLYRLIHSVLRNPLLKQSKSGRGSFWPLVDKSPFLFSFESGRRLMAAVIVVPAHQPGCRTAGGTKFAACWVGLGFASAVKLSDGSSGTGELSAAIAPLRFSKAA